MSSPHGASSDPPTSRSPSGPPPRRPGSIRPGALRRSILPACLALVGTVLAVLAWDGPPGTVVDLGVTTAVKAAATVAAVLIAGVAAFQVALGAGAPLGEAVFGGKAPTDAGVLSAPFRALAVVQAGILLLVGWVLLLRADVVTAPGPVPGVPGWAIWTIVAFLGLNTVANLAAPHPIERWVMGSITFVLAGLGLVIALWAP